LDELCAYWNWDKSLITLDTSNPAESHPEYDVRYTVFSHATAFLVQKDVVKPWNKEKYYGLFIGRANSTRIRAIHNHKQFLHKEYGLTSFNTDLFNFMDQPELIDYYCHSNQTYTDMISIRPYSDISELVATPPIGTIIDTNYNSQKWSSVYEKIAIEIVCETSTLPNCIDSSEKTFRPMFYKRPFLLVGSPGQIDVLKETGFKTFSPYIPEDYDSLTGLQRVDRIFEILDELIKSKRIETLLDDCSDILEHNHKLLVSEIEKHRTILKKRQFIK